MSNPEALMVPEILTRIARFVSRGQAATCMRVCKAWKPEFEREAWSTVEYTEHYPNVLVAQVPLRILKQKAHLIRHLVYIIINKNFNPTLALRCPNLQTVRFGINGNQWDALTSMIQDQPFLYKLEIRDLSPDENVAVSESFLKAMLTCPKLALLETADLLFDQEGAKQYFRSIANTHRVTTRDGSFSNYLFDSKDEVSFPSLQSLQLRKVASLQGQVEWIVRCPSLVSLLLEPHDDTTILTRSGLVEEFSRRVPDACPHLKILDLRLSFSDEEMAKILDSLKAVEKLTVPKSDFGPQSLDAIRSHFITLKEINIQNSVYWTSESVQALMSSCPNLESLCADELRYEDLIRNSWVCRGLRRLDINIAVDKPRDQQMRVFKKLAKLKRLEWLRIGRYKSATGKSFWLDLSFTAGINSLKSLRRLQYFHGCDILELAIEKNGSYKAVRWILANWGQLKTLQGHIPGDYSAYRKTKRALKRRGIKYIEDAACYPVETSNDERDEDESEDDDDDTDDDDDFYDDDDSDAEVGMITSISTQIFRAIGGIS